MSLDQALIIDTKGLHVDLRLDVHTRVLTYKAALFALTRSVLSLHLRCMRHEPWHTQSFFGRERLRQNNGSFRMDIHILPHMDKGETYLIIQNPKTHHAGNPCAGNTGDAPSWSVRAHKASEKIVVEPCGIGIPMRRGL